MEFAGGLQKENGLWWGEGMRMACYEASGYKAMTGQAGEEAREDPAEELILT